MRKKPAKSPKKSAKRDIREKILQAFLVQVPFNGWTETAYAMALQQARISRAEADKSFPYGVTDCVAYFGALTDIAIQQRIESERGFHRLRVRDKITFAVRARLEILEPHREAMRRLMMWHAHPQHAATGLKRLYKTVDLIWIAAGDTSTDYNFYTKRILLAAVFKTTMLFWLGDETDNHAATWNFLDRRIGEVMKLGKGISLLKEFSLSEIADVVRDKLKRAI